MAIGYEAAISKAMEALKQSFPKDAIGDVFLEAWEKAVDGKYFLVTLGFNRKVTITPIEKSIGASPVRREYKIARVNRETGEVEAIDIKGSTPIYE